MCKLIICELKIAIVARHRWLMSIILATQEAEVRRITINPGKIVHETLSQKNPSHKKGWWSGSRCRP
jgi:4-hydroxy-3-methylbut-2-en-1-yl diphosphate synthase IspG/GcpE